MKSLKVLLASLCILVSYLPQITAQELTQTIRGTVTDAESQVPIIGATIYLLTAEEGTTTDVDGSFKFENIALGRHNLEISYLGYKPVILSSLLLSRGKELVLNLEMEESAVELEAVEVSAESSYDKSSALNSFATVSSRTFSVEETSRYAAASFDPARMALNYAGVATGASDDLFNEIIIRGNSPSGVLWRLEGIEIPNPNHFGDIGNSGGAISMLSSSTLSNSDFYTGAFPAEFGNATSGVFDLKMRNGNNEKRESSFMFGALGVELSTEGPLSKKSKSSYLINYRYSTLALLQASGINPAGEILPTYQDLSFRVNFPTDKAGTFALFGLGGNNLAADNPAKDSLEWENEGDRRGFEEKGNMGVVGLSHNILLSNDSYLKTVVIGSFEKVTEDSYRLNDNYERVSRYKDDIQQLTGRIASTYNRKFNARSSIRAGLIYSQKKFDFSMDTPDVRDGPLFRRFDNTSDAGLLQAHGQWKHKPNDKLTLNAGIHYSYLLLNDKQAIEPRVALSYQLSERHKLTFASGLHSKMENVGVYSFEGVFRDGFEINEKKNLGLTKSFHNVLGYDFLVNQNLRLKAEAYYQHLYDVPIRPGSNETFSLINTTDVFDIIEEPVLVPEGIGRNIGLDLTVERFFSRGLYFLLTGSLYDSKFKTNSGKPYNTRFNGTFQGTSLAGKEWKVGKKKKNILGVNGKFVISGGGRYTPVNLEASIIENDEVLFLDRPFEARTGNYFRVDWGLSYRINGKRATHTIMFDIQNTTNRENPAASYYDEETQRVETEDMVGLFPFFNYRIEF